MLNGEWGKIASHIPHSAFPILIPFPSGGSLSHYYLAPCGGALAARYFAAAVGVDSSAIRIAIIS
jgi:hypothetical protein